MPSVIDCFVCGDEGVRLAVRDFGGNGPALILIHGFFGNLGQYDDFGPMLTDHYRVVAYDQRGHGWSESGPTSISTYVDDLRTVREALDLEAPVLYGGSFGAQVALAYLHSGHVACAFVNEDGQISDWPPGGPGDPPQPDGPRILSADQVQAYVDYWATFGSAGTASATRSMQTRGDGDVELRPTQTELNAKGLAFSELPILDCYRATDVPVVLLAAARGPRGEPRDRDAAIEHLQTICECDVRRFSTGHWITAEDPNGAAALMAEFSHAL